jgi:hypothetical protein
MDKAQNTLPKSAAQQIYSKLHLDQGALGTAMAAYKRINGSFIFDSAFYSKCYPDVHDSGLEPIAHFVVFGAREGRSPHPLFHCNYYKKQLSDAGIKTTNALKYFLDHGSALDLKPHPLFDPRFYCLQSSEMIENPLEHYLAQGPLAAGDPYPLFDRKYYLDTYEDVRALCVDPLIHYVLIGAFEARSPHRLFDAEYYCHLVGIKPAPRIKIEITTGSTAEGYYERLVDAAIALNPDPQNPTRLNPLIHYLENDSVEECSPHPLFSTKYYIVNSPDIQATRTNPLLHYVLTGQAEHRRPHLLFDPEYYVKASAQTDENAKLKPLEHFLACGGKAALAPNQYFDAKFYLSEHPEVVRENLNPLVHYLKTEPTTNGLATSPTFDGGIYASLYPDVNLLETSTLEHYMTYGVAERRATNYFDRAFKRGIDPGFYRNVITVNCIEVARIPKVSLVLFGLAEEAHFLRCVSAIDRQRVNFRYDLFMAGEDHACRSAAQKIGIKVLAENCSSPSKACYIAAQSIEDELIVFIDKNMQAVNDWLFHLISACFSQDKLGMVCSAILSPLGRVISAGAQLSDKHSVTDMFADEDAYDPENKPKYAVDVCRRGGVAIPRKLFLDLNGYDATLGNALSEDVDLSKRIVAAGYNNYCQPRARIVSLSQS